MRISDWSSVVCSSDLKGRLTTGAPFLCLVKNGPRGSREPRKVIGHPVSCRAFRTAINPLHREKIRASGAKEMTMLGFLKRRWMEAQAVSVLQNFFDMQLKNTLPKFEAGILRAASAQTISNHGTHHEEVARSEDKTSDHHSLIPNPYADS